MELGITISESVYMLMKKL